MGDNDPPAVEPGSILAGRYKIGSIVGRGGMGIVVKATHLQLDTPVAIKVLKQEALEEPVLVERFLREARSNARLRSEYVCRVTDFGTAEDGSPFMVMEYLVGDDLKDVVDHRGALEPTEAATYILQACVGVAEAHAIGIVHRDLKPANLFLVRRPDGQGAIKLLDFGIAKSTARHDTSLTATTRAMGSPAYMSPEQLRSSAEIDPRSDIWALGITLYELVTEQRPFDGDTPYELALAIAQEPPAPLPASVPSELAAIIMRCLDKDPARRYQNVGALATALAPLVPNGAALAASARAALAIEAIVDELSEKRAPRADQGSPATETTLRGASGSIDADHQLRSRSWWLAGLVAAVLATTAVGAVLIFSPFGERKNELVAPPAAAPVAQPPEPPPAPPAPPAPTLIDAAATPVAVDAAVEPDEPPTPTPPTTKPIKRRPPKTPKAPKAPKSPKTDLGTSRY